MKKKMSLQTIDNRFKIVIDEIKKIVDNILDQPYELILYGSVARGEAKKDSDIDLLLLINGPVSFELKRLILRSVYEIELKREVLISLLIKSKEIWETKYAHLTLLYSNIQKEGLNV